MLGTVVPIWDDTIAVPEQGFTTRFEMRRRMDEGADIASDLEQFLPDDDRSSLAILAMSGLERLELDDQVWELGFSEEQDGSFEVTALSENENRLWRVFPAQFKPSREAIACFLEHRKIRPTQDEREQVYVDAARTRRVLGVLPLDNDGIPTPPTRGHVYATLPTEVTLPFGFHIHADWLLNISRSGLREIEDNPWQRNIVDKIVDILERFLYWSADTHSQPVAAKAAFKALREPSSEVGGLETLLAEERWLSKLRDRIKDAEVLPVWTETAGKLAYAKASDTLVPPVPLARAFGNQPELRPAVLLKGRVVMDDVLGRNASGLLHRIGLLLQKLELPTSDNRRITLDRIVQHVGGRHRGPLGGWVVPLDHIKETLRTELEHAEFPHKFPVTITGGQALDYILDVWTSARESPEGLANKVRGVLPTAYAYCMEDIAKDESLKERWHKVVHQAMVFTEREWTALTDVDDIYFDDIEDRRFFSRQARLRTVTGGHLGRSRPDQLSTVEAIHLPLLSSIVTREWIGGDEELPVSDDWISRFELICELLREVRGSEPAERGGTDSGTRSQRRHGQEPRR